MDKSKAKKAMEKYEKIKKASKPGTGKRFKALTEALEAKGIDNPEALAAYIGRKKYGKKKMAEWAAKGKKAKSKKK